MTTTLRTLGNRACNLNGGDKECWRRLCATVFASAASSSRHKRAESLADGDGGGGGGETGDGATVEILGIPIVVFTLVTFALLGSLAALLSCAFMRLPK